MKITHSRTYQAPNANKSFGGLSAKLAQHIYTKEEIFALCKKYKNSDGKVGKLPAEWIYQIPFEKRKEGVKNILKNFGAIFSKLRSSDDTQNLQNTVAKKITDLFTKTGLPKENAQAKVEYLKSGAFADVYKLTLQEKEYAVKIFKNLKASQHQYDPVNGNGYEQNIFCFLQKKIPLRNKNWVQFYFGDIKNGILVTKFENGKKRFKGNPYDLRRIGLYISEFEHYSPRNNIGGKIIDTGCIEPAEYVNNKTFRYAYNKASQNQDTPFKILTETLRWKDSAQREERLKGIVYSLRLLDKKQMQKNIQLLLETADENLSIFIINQLKAFPHGIRNKIFDSMIAKNNERIDTQLAIQLNHLQNFGYISPQQFKKLKDKNNVSIDTELVKQLSGLHLDAFRKSYPLFLKKTTPFIRQQLAESLYFVQKNRQIEYLRQILQKNNPALIETLFTKSSMYSPQTIEKMFDMIFQRNYIEEQRVLAKNIAAVPKAKTEEWFSKLYNLEDDTINMFLAQNLKYTKANKNVWETLLMNY